VAVSVQTLPSSPLRPASSRTLSKSDYILARSCPAKLFFRENGYADNRDGDAYVAMLAEGGYMVEALAKARYEGAIQLEYGRSVAKDYELTRQHLDRETVTLFEATLLVGRRQARVDILEKSGNIVRLIEVKAKSFDGQEHLANRAGGGNGVFRAKRKAGGILADWRAKLEDLTYQVLLLEKLLPGVTIRPFLALTDKRKRANADNVPGFFELVRRNGRDGVARLHTARYIGTREQLADLDLVTEVDVSEEVDMLRDQVEEAAALFESRLDAPLAVHARGVQRGSHCGACEFRHDIAGEPSGFDECWGPLALPSPHMLELFSIGSARAPDKSSLVEWMLGQDKASLLEIPEAGLVKADGTIGTNAERQRRQIAHTRSGEIFVGPGLRDSILALRGPLHFIDFETSRLALPYHAGMRPYGQVSFQWSCHTVRSLGERPTHSDWLNVTDIWPNQSFAASLHETIGDEGPVLVWTQFEASVLKEIVRDIPAFGRETPELVEWMTDVVERRMVDLHEWARTQYYHPGMRGRTSIKVVLDALWKSDAVMRRQFEAWSGLPADASRDPYAGLPSVEINGIQRDVHEGTGAMLAYQEMMYGADRGDVATKNKWGALLKQYCGLDTLSMVLIVDHWRRATGLA
jgi:hypothetical protein